MEADMEEVTAHGEREDKGGQGNPHNDKTVTVIVNGREQDVPRKNPLTFDELIELAYKNPPTGEFICWTITYRKGHSEKPEGTVTDGGSVKPKEGMIFNVTYTDKS